MGVDICQYGNHKIISTDRNMNDIAKEIQNKLNSLHLVNIDYLKVLMNLWDSSSLEPPHILKLNMKNGIYKKIEYENWKWKYDIVNDEGYQYIRFIGFRNFELEFTKDKIFFWDPPYRFFGWFYMDSIVRNEWRKYMLQIIKLFGGDRAIYLPDNMVDSEIYLDDHDNIDSPFEEIENDLIKEYGKNKFTYETIKEEDEIYYYIDFFEDINIENNLSLVEFQNYLWKECEEEMNERMGK